MGIPARHLSKAACSLYGVMLVLAAAPAVPAVSLSDVPLFLTVAVPPNITLTLDDSGSMRRAFVPENCLADTSDCAALDNRYEKSARRNLIHYNPLVRYPQPRTGVGSGVLSTSFTAAYRNGFDTALGTINLSNNYRPTAYLDMGAVTAGATTEKYMGHYGTDVVRCRPTAPRQCQYTTNTVAPFTWNNFSPSVACTSDALCQGAQSVDPATPLGVLAYYYVYNAANAGCTGSNTSNACYSIRFVTATSGPGTTDINGDGVVDATDRDERQNFANWYSFARTRNLATQTAASIAFADLDTNARVAFQALNSCRNSATSLVDTDCDGWKNNFTGISNAIKPFTGTHKTNFYSWVFQQPTNGGTPLPEAMKRVGDYYKTTGANSPYDDNLASAAVNTETSCRKNYHILMTDGIWTTASTVGNTDDTTTDIPDPTIADYAPMAPYEDTASNTLADVAFKYWIEDLRGTLANNLTPIIDDLTDATDAARYWNPRNDPATWQHMVNFTIGLGLTGYLADAGLTWGGNMYNGSYNNLRSGATAWPVASTATNNPANVADLWHAAINSRGKFFSADDPASLSAAFAEALTDIADKHGSSAALSSNSTSLNNNSFIFQAKFNSDWSGTLLALPVSTTGDVGAVVWDASTLTPAHNLRKIYTHNGTSGVEFLLCTSLSATQKAYLDTDMAGVVDNQCTDRLAWLRGDSSKETRFAGGYLRSRPVVSGKTIVMGDVINSDPAFVKDFDYGYGSRAAVPGYGTYDAYVTANASRPAMVYVGANDGKLYGLYAEHVPPPAIPSPLLGVEQFAYVPGGIYEKLGWLTDPGYTHHYYVDGSITVGDAYIGGTPSWKTILVAGLNSGGRSIYALDVSSPLTFNAASVKWEYTEADLGLTFSQPQIGVLENGQWVAVFGNGYNSTNGGAYLYVVNLDTGALIRKITVSDTPATDESNGLSTPVLFDNDDNGLIDTVYAGDLAGNLWKVDVSGASGTWAVAYSGAPLFTATNPLGQAQPITSQPQVAKHTPGYVVYFGTGRYLAGADVSDTTVQSFYAVYDNGSTVTRAQMTQQTMNAADDVSSRRVRTSSSNTVDWATQKGWYMDLTPGGVAAGERVVSKAILKQDRAIFVTVVPSGDSCTPGGTSWLVELDMLSGGATECVFDLNNNGVFDEATEKVGGASGSCPTSLELTVGISKTPVWLDAEDEEGPSVKILTGTTGTIEAVDQPPNGPTTPAGPGSIQRRSWIQIR